MQDRTIAQLLAAVAVVHLLFAVWPQIDIATSRVFFTTEGTFWLAGNRIAEDLRALAWTASLACALMAFGMLLCTLRLGPRAASPWRLWAMIAALYVIGPGLFVNLLLKEHWGRARPVDVSAFGGAQAFTPPFEMAGACLRNCSFVSGEAAAAAVLALVLGLVLVDRGLPLRRTLCRMALAGLFLCVAGHRIAAGRHFLSDVVFAGLFMLIFARLLHVGLRVQAPAGRTLLAAMRADLTAVLQPAGHIAAALLAGVRQRIVR